MEDLLTIMRIGFVLVAQLDLSLVGWLLLFLSRNLDNTHMGPNIDDEKSSKDKDNGKL